MRDRELLTANAVLREVVDVDRGGLGHTTRHESAGYYEDLFVSLSEANITNRSPANEENMSGPSTKSIATVMATV